MIARTRGASTPPTASGGISRLALARADAAGFDTAPLICRAGLSAEEVADPNVRIGMAEQVALLAVVGEALGDDLLGLHLAAEFDPREVGLVYFVLASSGTLAEAFARAERYTVIMNDGILLHPLGGDEVGVRYTYVGVPRHADRHQIEFWAMAFVRIAAQLTGTRIRPVRIAFGAGNRTERQRPVWMAPALQGICEGLARWSGAVLCPACLRGHEPLALMVSADEVPFCFAGLTPWTLRRVVLVPGPTGSPSLHMVLATSSRDTALIENVLRPLPSRAPASGRSRHGP
jgi:hypothetical protein